MINSPLFLPAEAVNVKLPISEAIQEGKLATGSGGDFFAFDSRSDG